MPSAHDIAAYILAQKGEMSTWKLQKLVYYAQAWHLVWEEQPLFPEPIEAWANGPVVRALYNEHRGKFKVGHWGKGTTSRLTESERGTVDAVLKFYGDRPGHWLSELTHAEAPWRDARKGLPSDARSTRRITHAAMANYYSSL